MYLGVVDGKLKKAFPGGRGKCPACNVDLIAKCGSIKMWHWAHERDENCLGRGESETEWHRHWKETVPMEWWERIIKIDGIVKRTDILKLTAHPVAYEFQHSYISPEEIQARERFYLDVAKCGLVWIFDVRQGKYWQSGESQDEDRLHISPAQAKPGDEIDFYWENGRTSILYTRTQLYLDLGHHYIGEEYIPELMILVRKFSDSGKFSGKGRLITKQTFLDYELLFYLPPIGWNQLSPVYDNILQFEYDLTS